MTLNFTLCRRIFQSTLFALLLNMFFTTELKAADGEKLFIANCKACHTTTSAKLVGPGLKDLDSRVPSREWTRKWVHDSQSLVNSGDSYAVKVFKENNSIPMTSFPALTDADIDAILDYVKTVVEVVPAPSTVSSNQTTTNSTTNTSINSKYILKNKDCHLSLV